MSVADKLSALATAAAEAAAAMRGVPVAAVPPAPPPMSDRAQRLVAEREKALGPLMTMDISQLMHLRPAGWIRSDDIADALIARDAEVQEYTRNFQAPGAAEARAAADEAEHSRYVSEAAATEERQRIERETQEATAARAAAEKVALAAQRKAAVEARDAFQKLQLEESRGLQEARQAAEVKARIAADPYLADFYARQQAARVESARWTLIGQEGDTVEVPEGTTVRYGDIEKVVGPEGRITADNNTFGRDPQPGVKKQLYKLTGGRRRKTRRRKTRHHRRSKTSKRAFIFARASRTASSVSTRCLS